MNKCEAKECPAGIGEPGYLLSEAKKGEEEACKGCYYFHKNYPYKLTRKGARRGQK